MTPMTLADAEQDLTDAYLDGAPERIVAAEALVDKLDVPRSIATLHASALWYAEQGLHVFPLQPGSKVPFKGSNGCKGATTDLDKIDAWWHETPQANIGIATGFLVDVIDIDGPGGVKAWLDVEDPPTILGRVSTPRPGGTHLYIAAQPGRTNRAGLLPHVDLRASGGYVVAPPSINDQGAYWWRTPLDVAALTMAGAA